MKKLRQYFNTKVNSFVLLLLAIWTSIRVYLPVDPLTPDEIAISVIIAIFTSAYFIVDTIENKE